MTVNKGFWKKRWLGRTAQVVTFIVMKRDEFVGDDWTTGWRHTCNHILYMAGEMGNNKVCVFGYIYSRHCSVQVTRHACEKNRQSIRSQRQWSLLRSGISWKTVTTWAIASLSQWCCCCCGGGCVIVKYTCSSPSSFLLCFFFFLPKNQS